MSLTICGQWSWREDEISLKQFYKLPQKEKDEYVLLLAGLKPEERSTGDNYIFSRYGQHYLNKNKPKGFFSLEDI
jgi:hypothetical protein